MASHSENLDELSVVLKNFIFNSNGMLDLKACLIIFCILTVSVVAILVCLRIFIKVFFKKNPLSSVSKVDTQPTDSSITTPQRKKPDLVDEIKNQSNSSWLSRLKLGLSKTRSHFEDGLSKLLVGSTKIDSDTLESLHEILFRSDLGVKTTHKLVERVSQSLKGNQLDIDELKQSLYEHSKNILDENNQKPLTLPPRGPRVILIVGVNGVGKTTTIGKLAAKFISEDQNVILCAGDTFRAAAIDQLKIWGDRLGVKVIAHQQGSDPAAVAYDGVKAAVSRKADTLIIDTAGRLHNKKGLMNELSKIRKVIGKDLPEAPHETWLVVDATTGQNAFQQVKAFDEVAQLTGIIVTKLDGTAKGGVLIGISDQFKHPIRFIGVGEKASDLRQFDSQEFLKSLFLESNL